MAVRYSRAVTVAEGVAGRSASGTWSRIGVSIEPGQSTLTRTPWNAASAGARGEADDRVLGRCVRRDERRGNQARAGCGVHDVPATLFDHPRVRRENTVDHAVDVHVDDPGPVRARELVRRSAHRDAGVVEQVVDPAEALRRSRRRGPGTRPRRACRAGGRRSRRVRSRVVSSPAARRRLRRRCRRARRGHRRRRARPRSRDRCPTRRRSRARSCRRMPIDCLPSCLRGSPIEA